MSTLKTNQFSTTTGTVYNSAIQFVSIPYSTIESFATTDGVARNTQMVASITPRYKNSKILAIASVCVGWTVGITVCRIRMARYNAGGSDRTTAVQYSPAGGNSGNVSGWTTVTYGGANNRSTMYPNSHLTWYDTPNTTGEVAYRIQLSGNSSGSNNIWINRHTYGDDRYSGVSWINLMEIQQ